jgi:catechol 2,3-dioxygenase-like lactoylglutathione lyase family enzyme
VNCIDLVSIPVSDQQKSKAFYMALGFSLLEDNPMGGGKRWIQLGFAGCPTGITLVTWFPRMTPGSMHGFVIRTENLDREISRLKANGIEPQKVEDTPWGKFATVADPDGNTISIRQDRVAASN